MAISDDVLGSRVMIRARGFGTATVTVTARDPGGLEAMQTIHVAVKGSPERVGTIPNQSIVVGQTTELDVSSYFRDQDGDLLSFGAESSNANVVTVSVSGSSVTIRGVSAAPLTWVTVIARDPDGNESRQQFSVGVREPVTIRITECFIVENQHFARFKVTARVSVSSLVVKTYAVDSRNNEQHIMKTTNIGDLSAGNSYEELTTRFFPAHLARFLTTCGVSATATSN